MGIRTGIQGNITPSPVIPPVVVPTLQDVTDQGNVTNNDIILEAITGEDVIVLSPSGRRVTVQTLDGLTNTDIEPNLFSLTRPSTPGPGLVTLDQSVDTGVAGNYPIIWRVLAGVPALLSDLLKLAFKTVSGANYNVLVTDQVIYYTASTGSTCTLPNPATTVQGQLFYIKNIGSVAVLTVTAVAGIDTGTTYLLPTQYAVVLQSIGGQYEILATYQPVPKFIKTVPASAYTVALTDNTILVNSSSQTTVTLPTPASATGRIYNIVRINAARQVDIVVSGGANINGAATFSLLLNFNACAVQSDGTQYWVISN